MKEPSEDGIAQAAAEWIVRCQRGLTAPEQDQFFEWLAADARHGEELARHGQTWKQLDQLVEWRPEYSSRPNPDLLAPPLRSRVIRLLPWAAGIAAAAAITLTLFFTKSGPLRPSDAINPVAPAAPAGPLVLEDGSIVELNNGGDVVVEFSAHERRVRLRRGEAHFIVSKNPARPFIVSADAIDVRAVGTVFNVRFDKAGVEVLVTEGKVQVDAAPVATSPSSERSLTSPLVPLLLPRQRAIISTGHLSAPPQIDTLSVGEIDRVLAWQHRLLTFNATPLVNVVREFNRRNVVQLVIVDPDLESVGISGQFRTDNIDVLLTLLEKQFGVRAMPRSETEIRLGNGPSGAAP